MGCIVECLALNPYWCLYNILLMFRNDMTLSYMIFSNSNTVENEMRRLIGQ